MKQDSYLQTVEDFSLNRNIYIYFENTMIELSFKEDVRLVNGVLHSFINKINLN